tara:strand:- start:4211 stop:4525 length:315 start_codon:yes stop_codon:yes gene_type:complete
MAVKGKNDIVRQRRDDFISKWGSSPAKIATKEIAQIVSDLSSKIHKARVKSKLTQQQLAKLSGVSQAVVARMESKTYDGRSLASLVRIATALEFEIEVLVNTKQ